jgi:tetrahydromethanopterin S-methyltransferase subunit D
MGRGKTLKEHNMRQSVLTIMAAGAVTAFAMVTFPAQAQFAHCVPGRGCVPTTQASYNACLTLARQRGWTDSDNAPRGGIPRALDEFVYRCLQGRIPR